MNKTIARVIAFLLAALLLLSLVTAALAEELETSDTILINSLEDFLSFAENCRMDSYSQGKHFVLTTDLVLSGSGFEAIPVFCGTFDGAGNTITGLKLTTEGSYQGLFRYLTETATVKNLELAGTVAPGGSRSYVGGLVGTNEGTVENCSFIGNVSGRDIVGGLVGSNGIGGTIKNCTVSGTVHGNHFIGGIAGENKGVIENCTNRAEINTTEAQNSVDISDVTIDSILDAESALSVTDIGGIAGTSSGAILGCTNQGNVGYQYMGYNVGGIVGSQSGYTAECRNDAQVYGRKEVGGIVGQLEPYTTVSFETDALQILKEQVADLSEMTKRATTNAKENFNNIGALITKLENHVAAIENATAQLTIDEDGFRREDIETVLSALETIGENVAGINETVDDLYAAIKDTTTTLNTDLEQVSRQVDVISSTLDNASENLGGTALDVSDEDTAEDTDSKVENCLNFGKVLGDLNAGGIVGAIGVENDLDPEADVSIIGDTTLNYAVDVRSVILNCSNSGTVQVRKQRAGGIVGWMSLGLTKGCTNTGTVEAKTADYAGGIVGSSQGFVRECNAKCSVSGDTYVGGIAGEATVLSHCRSMVVLENGAEKLGNLIGYVEDREEITENYYLCVGADRGGIDGISYAGIAQPLNREEFLALDNLIEMFRTVSLYFRCEDGTQQVITAELGADIPADSVPDVPEKEGYTGHWEGLTAQCLENVSFDAVYQAVYTSVGTVIESDLTADNGMPVLLAQGEFYPGDQITVRELAEADCLTAWEFSFPVGDWATSIRCLMPEGCVVDRLSVSVRDESGQWREVEFSVSGSYLVAQIQNGDDGIRLTEKVPDYTLWIILAVAAFLMVIVVITVVLTRKKGKKKGK